jgi:hypothetical protein
MDYVGESKKNQKNPIANSCKFMQRLLMAVARSKNVGVLGTPFKLVAFPVFLDNAHT